MKINRTLHVFLAIILLTGLNVRVVPDATPPKPLLPGVLLLVDTMLDNNAAGYQGCQSATPGDCSLRGAVSRANAEPTVIFTIQIPPGTYSLSLLGEDDSNLTGDLDVHGNIVIDRQAAGHVIVSADGLDRVFQFFPGAYGDINNLTVTGGQAGPGQSGGGIYNAGSLSLMNVIVEDNRAGDGRMATINDLLGEKGGSGGGIENLGELSLQNCTISANQAGKGGDTLPEYSNYPVQTGGTGGAGGGIANRGSLEVLDTGIRGNQAGAGGKGRSTYVSPWSGSRPTSTEPVNAESIDFSGAGHGGDGGGGGGIFNGGQLEIIESEVINNLAGEGGAGGVAYILGGYGGKGGNGGGISNFGRLYAENTLIGNNQSGLSGLSGFGDYKQGEAGTRGPGYGGGLYNVNRTELVASQVLANLTAPEVLGSLSRSVANGGGIYNDPPGDLSLRDTFVLDNQASGDGGGILNAAELTLTGGRIESNQARGLGGGIRNDGWLQGSSFSLTDNISGPGYAGFQPNAYFGGLLEPTDGGTPGGGGIFNAGKAWLTAVQINQNLVGDGGKGGNSNVDWPEYIGGDGGDGGYGGGIYNQGWLGLNLCTLRGNQTGQGGLGGTSNYQNGANGTGGPGGAIYNSGELHAAFLTIQENNTGAGASPTEPGGPGGGLFNTGSLSLRDSQVIGNQTALGGVGGGISILGCSVSNSNALIANTSIINNHAGADGGGVYLSGCNARLDNLVIAGNQIDADSLGSGIFLEDHNPIMRHLTFATNFGGDGSGIYLQAGMAVFTNTILAGQPIGIYVAQDAQAQMQTTLWGAGEWGNSQDSSGPGTLDIGLDNLIGDPLFLDPAHGDYHLTVGSPAVDAGQLTDLSVDLDNQPRPAPGAKLPDIGADEIWLFVPLTGLSLVVPQVVTATTPAEFRIEIVPPDATPDVQYLWSPPPQAGQWTSQAVYTFEHGGEQSVTVWAIQAGKASSTSVVVPVQPVIRSLFLPLVSR